MLSEKLRLATVLESLAKLKDDLEDKKDLIQAISGRLEGLEVEFEDQYKRFGWDEYTLESYIHNSLLGESLENAKKQLRNLKIDLSHVAVPVHLSRFVVELREGVEGTLFELESRMWFLGIDAMISDLNVMNTLIEDMIRFGAF